MRRIGVVHLVRRMNGIAPFKRFLDSYLRVQAGCEHELALAFKGFDDPRDLAPYEPLIASVPHRRLFAPEQGFDLNVYFLSVRQLDYDYFCFLNSFSRILAPEWLAKLYRHVSADGVGLVGATSSCQSIAVRSEEQERYLRTLSPAQRFGRRKRLVFDALRKGTFVQQAGLWLLRRSGIWRPRNEFPPFPNYHLRTNAFMAARDVLAGIDIQGISTKLAAYRFESGNDSMTNQVRRRGLRVLVVGADGKGYEPEQWHLSNTFWQSAQENLLVSDNQTELYNSAGSEQRMELARYAWGHLARAA